MLDEVLAEFAGKVRLVFKDRPLPGHAVARPAHEAARCAGAAGSYWAYHDRLYAAQPAFGRDQLIGYAAELGLDRAAFARCLDERRHAPDVERDLAQAQALGITRTPSFLINGRLAVGALATEDFRWLINEALRQSR